MMRLRNTAILTTAFVYTNDWRRCLSLLSSLHAGTGRNGGTSILLHKISMGFTGGWGGGGVGTPNKIDSNRMLFN
jgi:hypothetical protein